MKREYNLNVNASVQFLLANVSFSAVVLFLYTRLWFSNAGVQNTSTSN